MLVLFMLNITVTIQTFLWLYYFIHIGKDFKKKYVIFADDSKLICPINSQNDCLDLLNDLDKIVILYTQYRIRGWVAQW